MPEIATGPTPSPLSIPRLIYSSVGTVTIGNNSTARATMIPPGIGVSSLLVRGGTMPPGSYLQVIGTGVISATTVGSPTFSFLPHVTPAGGSKTDLAGRSVAPLIGVAGICDILFTITQTATGLICNGRVRYAADNTNNHYPVEINPNQTVTASDFTVDRTFGIDGQWSVAAAANYVTPEEVKVTLWTMGL